MRQRVTPFDDEYQSTVRQSPSSNGMDGSKPSSYQASVPQTLEALQTALTLPDGLVRVLDSVVLAPAVEM